MNTNPIDTLKNNVTHLDLKNLKDIVMNPKLKKWRKVYLKENANDEVQIWDSLVSHIDQVLEELVFIWLFNMDKSSFFEVVFQVEVFPEAHVVVEFFDKLFDKTSI